jgi:hypothetical protein
VVEGELSPAMSSDWTCKSAHPFVRAQRDESADAICRFLLVSNARQAEWIYVPWVRPGGGESERGNVALYRFSTVPCLLTEENWLGILAKQESNPDAP